MTEKLNKIFRGPVGIGLILALEVIGFLFFIFMLADQTGFILIAGLVLAVAAVWYLRKNHALQERISGTFGYYRSATRGGLIALLLAFPILLALLSPDSAGYWMLVIVTTILFIMACLGLNLQLGSTGMMNLAGAAFYAFGAYSAGLLAIHFKITPWITIPLGAIITGVLSIILFIPILRTKGHYLALVTIAFQFMAIIWMENTEWTGGPQGLKNVPLISIGDYSFARFIDLGFVKLSSYANYYYLALILAVALIIICNRLYHSWVGVTLSTIRDDEVAAKTSGVIVNYWKLIIFVIGNIFIGLAGAFYAHMVASFSPPVFDFTKSLLMVSIVIIGGMDNILGIVVGAVLLYILPEKLRFIQDYRWMIYGLVLVFTLIFRPQGIFPFKPRNFMDLIRKSKKSALPEEN